MSIEQNPLYETLYALGCRESGMGWVNERAEIAIDKALALTAERDKLMEERDQFNKDRVQFRKEKEEAERRALMLRAELTTIRANPQATNEHQ